MKTWYVDVGVYENGHTKYLFMDDLDNPTVGIDYPSLELAMRDLSEANGIRRSKTVSLCFAMKISPTWSSITS